MRLTGGFGFGVPLTFPTIGVFNMVPREEDAATFAAVVQGVVIAMDARVRNESDYGVLVTVANANTLFPLVSSTLTFWGVPADPSHDGQRGTCLFAGGSCPAGVSPKAFLTQPSDCDAAPGTTTLSVESWQHPGVRKNYSSTATAGLDRCDRLQFEPILRARPVVARATSPSGYTVDVDIPQNTDFDSFGTPPLRRAVVTLPQGVALSPSAADGLEGCTDAQFAVRSADASGCPSASKVGTLSIDTPLLADPLEGSVYIAQPIPGRMFRIFLEAQGSHVRVKLAGNIDLDPSTGQITTTFEDNPQVPFEHLHMTLKGGSRASLANPISCGSHTTRGEFTPYSYPFTPAVQTADSFEISADGKGAPCSSRGFTPAFAAGALSRTAGSDTNFTLTLSRDDSDQELRQIAVDVPKGLLANVGSVPLCREEQAAAGACGEGSRIGSVTTGAGPGPHPFFVPGRVYLTGPYRGAPFGLSIVVPAVAGPFDLGTLVVRSAVQIDRHTAVLKVVADPLPRILEGVPLQVRVINVTLDRKRFMVNPTNCSPMKISGRISSTEGTVADVSSPFQVDDCDALTLRPKMTLRVGGKGHTRPGSTTPLTTTLTQTPGQANLKSVSVRLPLALNAKLPVVTNACTQAEFDAGNCEKARAGSAVAVTPLLAHALRGGAYFVKDPKAPRGSLPNLVIALRGQVDFDLVGHVKIPDSNALTTRFETVPDVPIKKFTLSLVAGRKGPLGVAENLCSPESRRQTAGVVFRGQNGKVVSVRQRLKIAGCSKHGRVR